MWHRLVSHLLLAGILILPTAVARAADAEPDARIDHLVVGDGYWIHVERNGVQQDCGGDLAKATDRWIVLRSLSEGRSERGVPVLRKIPYIDRLFKNVGIGRTDNYVWIPREAATIRGRLRAAKPVDFEPPAGDEPGERSPCEVTFVGSDHKVADRDGKLLKIAKDRLTLVETERFSVEVRKPGWSNLPVVGGYFIDTRTETRETLTDIARSDLLCLRVRVANYAGPVPEDQASVRR
jgi:hypothetical protein